MVLFPRAHAWVAQTRILVLLLFFFLNYVKGLINISYHNALLSAKKGDVAQLVERRTGTPLRQVRFPSAERDFSARFRVDSLSESGHFRMHSHALTSVRTLKIL